MAHSKDLPPFPPLFSDAEIEQRRAAPRAPDPPAYDPWPVLDQRFPRIAKTIREQWGTSGLDRYFDQLLISERDRGRAGFPPEVVEALLALSHQHADRFHLGVPLREDWTIGPKGR